MASELGVNTIQHTNGTDAITVGSTGIISQPNLPVFLVDKTADQGSIADNTKTLITFDDVVFDPESVWDTTNNRLTVDANTKGYWWFGATLYTNSTQNLESAQLYARKNGSEIYTIFGTARSVGGSGGPSKTEAIYTASFLVDLTTSGDYFDLVLEHDCSSGGTTTVNRSGNQKRTFVQGYRLR